jgi:uncharacterized protein
MLNYQIDPSALLPLIPKGTELDSYYGTHLVSVVGFQFLRTQVLGIPLIFHRDFEEINLRFYVRRRVGEGWRRGVVFVKEIVPRIAIAAVARWIYNENYVACPMNSSVRLPDPAGSRTGSVEYSWISGSRRSSVGAEFHGTPGYPAPGSEEEFITEHYWGYVSQRDGTSLEYRVEHPQWRVWRTSVSEFDCDIKGFYGQQYHAVLSQTPSSAFVAEGSDVVVFRGKRIPR